MKYLQNILIAVALLLAGFGVYKAETVNVSAPVLGSVNPVTPAVFETYLANAEGTADTSLTLASASLRDGNTLSGYVCLTIDSNTSSLEYECGTASGTTVSNLQRGLDATTGTTTVSALIFAHRRGADVKITDYPTLTIVNNQLNGIQSIPNPLFYTYNFSSAFWTNAASSTLVTLGQLNNTAFAGVSNANTTTKGIVQLATGLQAASSTSTGSTGANLVLPASIATDTPNVGSNTSDVLMSDLTGHLKQAWLDLSATFAWTGTQTWSALGTFNGGLTATATTTISASNVLSNALKLNTVPYSFPSSGIASSTHWSFDATGKATYEPDQQFQNGTLSLAANAGATAVSTNFKPTVIRMWWSYPLNTSGTVQILNGSGTWINGTYSETYGSNISGSSGGLPAVNAVSDTSGIVSGAGSGTTGSFSGAISAVSSTGFTLTMTNGTGATPTVKISWEAEE